jgi:hypothetical protein
LESEEIFQTTQFYNMTSNDDLMGFLLKMEEKRAIDREAERQELQEIRCFFVVRQQQVTVQCLAFVNESVSKQMVKFIAQ